MLKTTIDKPAKFTKFSRTLMIYAILREYVKHPAWFMLWTILTLYQFKRRLPKDVSQDFTERLVLEAWMYTRMKNKIGREKALAVMRAIIIPVAMVWYGAGFRLVEAARSYENIIKFHELVHEKMIKEDGNLKIDERSDAKYTYRNTFCPWNALFKKLDIPELTESYCALDNGLYNIYLPDEIIFHRGGLGKTIASGATYCQYIYEHHTPEGES